MKNKIFKKYLDWTKDNLIILIILISVFFILLILTIDGVEAANPCGNDQQSFLGTFKVNETITLKQICENCTFVNLSGVKYPNSSVIIYNMNMTKNGIIFSIDFNNTNDLGCYSYTTLGDLDGINTAKIIDFKITKTGRFFDEGQSIVSIGILLGALILAFLFSKFSKNLMENPKTFPIGFIFIFLSLILGIYSLFLSYLFSVDILEYEPLSNLTQTLFIIFLWVIVFIALISISFMVVAFVKELIYVIEKRKFGEDFNPITKAYE